jgi:hypothetical protein
MMPESIHMSQEMDCFLAGMGVWGKGTAFEFPCHTSTVEVGLDALFGGADCQACTPIKFPLPGVFVGYSNPQKFARNAL